MHPPRRCGVAGRVAAGVDLAVSTWDDIPDMRADRYGAWLVWVGQTWHAGSPGSFAYRLPVLGQGGTVTRAYADGRR
jgi:hypothetical protein